MNPVGDVFRVLTFNLDLAAFVHVGLFDRLLELLLAEVDAFCLLTVGKLGFSVTAALGSHKSARTS